MASKKSKRVSYGGSNNKVKMLVDALNLNTDDTLHSQVIFNDSTQAITFSGDVHVMTKEEGFGLKLDDNYTNYSKYSYTNNSFSLLEYLGEIRTYPSNKVIAVDIGISNPIVDQDYTIEFDAVVSNTKFEKSATHVLGVLFIYGDYLDTEINLDEEVFGKYYDNVRCFYRRGEFDYTVTTVPYQSLYRDGEVHHYICKMSITPEQERNYSSIAGPGHTISYIHMAIIVDDWFYEGGHVDSTKYDESLTSLISITNITVKDFPDKNYYNTSIQMVKPDGQTWFKMRNPGSDSIIGDSDPTATSYGEVKDVYYKLGESSIYDLSKVRIEPSSVNWWKYNEDLSIFNSKASFSFSGYNVQDSAGKDISIDEKYWVRARSQQQEYVYLNGNRPQKVQFEIKDIPINELTEISFDISFPDVESIYLDNIHSMLLRNWVEESSVYYDEQHRSPALNDYLEGIHIQGYSWSSYEVDNGKYVWSTIDQRWVLTPATPVYSSYINEENIETASIVDYSYRTEDGVGYCTVYIDVTPIVNSIFSVRGPFVSFEALEEAIPVQERRIGVVYKVNTGTEEEPNIVDYYWNPSIQDFYPDVYNFADTSVLCKMVIENLTVKCISTIDSIWIKDSNKNWLKLLGGSGSGGGSEVSIEPLYSTGNKVANISVDGQDCSIWVPDGSYTLPIASSSTLGGIKVGDNLSIDNEGRLSSTGGSKAIEISLSDYNALPQAEKSNPNKMYFIYDYNGGGGGGGGTGSTVQIIPVYSAGNKIADYIIDGVSGAVYVPIASDSVVGGIKIGSTLSIGQDGTLNYTLPTASGSSLGGVKIGDTLSISQNGVLDYNLPTASSSSLGGVKVENGSIGINGAGSIYVNPPNGQGQIGGVKAEGSTNHISIDQYGNISLDIKWNNVRVKRAIATIVSDSQATNPVTYYLVCSLEWTDEYHQNKLQILSSHSGDYAAFYLSADRTLLTDDYGDPLASGMDLRDFEFGSISWHPDSGSFSGNRPCNVIQWFNQDYTKTTTTTFSYHKFRIIGQFMDANTYIYAQNATIGTLKVYLYYYDL